MTRNSATNKSRGIVDVELPEYLPAIPADFTFKKTNVYQVPFFLSGTSNSIDTLNDSDNLFKFEKNLERVLTSETSHKNSSESATNIPSKCSIVPNKSIYLNYHATPNNEYFIRNLPKLAVSTPNNTSEVDIFGVIQKRNKLLVNRANKQEKLRNNWKRNIFNNMSTLTGANSFDIKLGNDKFTQESYSKMEKIKLKKINKFKENEFAWQKLKADIYYRLKEENHLLKQLELEERRLREMKELKERQAFEEQEREEIERKPKMVFKLVPIARKDEEKDCEVKEDSLLEQPETDKKEFWVTLKYKNSV